MFGVLTIASIQHRDVVRVDPDRLEALHLNLGERAAEDIILRALEEISMRCAKLDEARRKGDTARIGSVARGLSAIADQIGLVTLARVSRDVAVCAVHNDTPALAATMSRFSRVADRSLSAAWDFEGQYV